MTSKRKNLTEFLTRIVIKKNNNSIYCSELFLFFFLNNSRERWFSFQRYNIFSLYIHTTSHLLLRHIIRRVIVKLSREKVTCVRIYIYIYIFEKLTEICRTCGNICNSTNNCCRRINWFHNDNITNAKDKYWQ